MVGDDERRRVAERLRHSWTNVPDKNPVRHQLRVLFEIYSAVGLADDDDADAVVLFARLADLIDPGESGQNLDMNPDTVQIESPAVQIATECDRDALLALAGCVRKMGEDYDKSGAFGLGTTFRAIADRIREACGEVDE